MNPNNCDACGNDRNMCSCQKPGTVVVTANDMQVGGDHYRNDGYQHWDWVVDNKIGYLAGCATKYIARHKLKSGDQDLEKAAHYLSKLIEVGDMNTSVFMSSNIMKHHESKILTDNFIMASHLDHEQAVMVRLLAQYEEVVDLNVALNILHQYRKAQYSNRCVLCNSKLVGGVCPRVGCGSMFPGITTQKQAEMLAAAATAAANRQRGGGVVPGRATGVNGMRVDSRGVTGMEDPRGYEGDG